MSAKEQINKAIPGALAGGIVTLIITFISFGINKADNKDINIENRLKNVELNKVDKSELEQRIIVHEQKEDEIVKRIEDIIRLSNESQEKIIISIDNRLERLENKR